MDRNPAIEKQALLAETDSEDDEDVAYARGKSPLKLISENRETAFEIVTTYVGF